MNTGTPPIELDPRDWAEVARILREQVPLLEVWAFGSRAKRAAKPYSDLDLALITRQHLPMETLATLKDAFDMSDLPIRVDVVDWASTGEAFRKIIERDKVVVQRGASGVNPNSGHHDGALGPDGLIQKIQQ